MLRQIVISRGTTFLLTVALTACGGGGEQRGATDDPAAASDTAAAASTGPSARVVATVDSLDAPEAARWDPDQQVWFIANIDGEPDAKDNNGYITRLKPDGAMDSLKFIAGRRNQVTLHAPKGMAIVGDTLWVADIDAVRGFNRKTGAPVATVNVKGALFLNDIAIGPGGIYITDSGANVVYLIAGRKVTTAVKFDGKPSPNGIVWDSAGSRFIIVPFQDNAITAWAPGDSTPQKIGEGPGMQDGVEPFGGGRFLVTSWADSTLSVLIEGKLTKLAGNLAAPADIGYDRQSGRVVVPQLTENQAQIFQVDAGE
jgi:hypothetical protein